MPYYELSGPNTSPTIIDDDHWQEEWGREYTTLGPFFAGLALDAKYFPKSGYLEKKTKKLHKIVPSPWFMCDAEVCGVIEQIEPGTHKFFPYSVRASKTSKEIVAEYFIINICNSLKVFEPEKTDDEIFSAHPPNENRDDYEFVISALKIKKKIREHSPLKLSLHEDLMAGKHLVRDPRTSYRFRFYSDEMHEALKPFMEPTKYFTMLKTY